MENILILEDLKAMKPETIFASGITSIDHPWSGQPIEVNWIAIRGGIWDWAIYHSFHTNITMYTNHLDATNEMIARDGQKLHDMEVVRELVPCTNEALAMYRH